VKGVLSTLLMIAVPAAYAADSPAASSGPADSVPIEVFTAPTPKHIAAHDCMGSNAAATECKDIKRGLEGWVELNFMVDPSGKPYEVTVTSSSGNKDFEKSAKKVVEASDFSPGTVDGNAIESDYEFKFTFLATTPSTGASGTFVSEYRTLMKAISAKHKANADAAMRDLQVTNLYEDAYFGMATYMYQKQWGSDEQQLAGIQRAIAEESNARYLPKDMFQFALRASLQLQLRLRLYAEASRTVGKLRKLGPDDKSAAELASLSDQLEKLRDDGSRYDLQGEMPAGSWGLYLFRRHFRATVSQGYISQVKLRCQKKYVSFEFNSDLEYQVASKDGSCYMQLVGAPGAKFNLTQF
jgi:TonB family protein